ncbi:MAG: hypothetical protein KTR32_29680 [Granulosicoccus sp.]|nr:hypothetical protein [Granulosicoccus sp.]
MELTVPHRTIADTGSFPVEPDGVAQWLSTLKPLSLESDAREVYRGLKHSNRLHNDVDQRRAVLSCFIPVLRELQRHLGEMSNAQPLPLTREFARNAKLRDSLLREEAFAFKILLSDSEKPLADDARRAMQALARQAESVIHAYRPFPTALIEDAHQLYELAEEHKLLSARKGSELLSLQDHYRFILMLSVSDMAQQRARQLPLIIDFLRESIGDIHIERDRDSKSLGSSDYAVDLRRGSRPEPALSLLTDKRDDVRWFSITPMLYRIDQTSARIKISTAGMLGSDTLERQSLARLHVALGRSRQRRTPRRIVSIEQRVVFGHKEICAHLLYQPGNTPEDETTGWVATNSSTLGACLHNEHCRAGLVQVGELVSISDSDSSLNRLPQAESTKIDALLGIVRWIRANEEQAITIGVEYLARSIMPVRVVRDDLSLESNADDQQAGSDVGVGDSALIIACRVQKTVLQTMIVPSYLYQTGDKLTAMQGSKSRRVQLRKCLQTNGLFSQYSLVDG